MEFSSREHVHDLTLYQICFMCPHQVCPKPEKDGVLLNERVDLRSLLQTIHEDLAAFQEATRAGTELCSFETQALPSLSTPQETPIDAPPPPRVRTRSQGLLMGSENQPLVAARPTVGGSGMAPGGGSRAGAGDGVTDGGLEAAKKELARFLGWLAARHQDIDERLRKDNSNAVCKLFKGFE